jgi:hypothetical protein
LSIPLVGLVLWFIEKYRVRRYKRGTSRKKTLSIYIFVFLLAILIFRPLIINLRLIYRTNRYLLFIIYSLIAKRTLAPSRIVSADSSPMFLKKTNNKVVFQTNKTLLVTNTKIDSIILIYTPSLIFLVLIISFIFLYYRASKVFLIYYISIPYKINKNIQIIIIFLSKKTRRPFFVYIRLRIY